MPVLDQDAVAVGADGEVAGVNAPIRKLTQQFLRLALDLLFLPRNVRDDVTQNVERRHTRVPRP